MDSRPPKDKDLKGWLRRKGGRMNTWGRRYFVLTDKFLFMFMKDEDQKSQHCVTLDGQIIVELPPDPNDFRKGYFDIVSDKNPSDTLNLCAETEEEKKNWVCALRRALYADKGGALFSQSLEEILYWEKKEGRHIPYIVEECVEYLYKYGLDIEGVFRLPGRQAVIKDVIARFERGEKIKFEDEGTDVHVVASVLKTFLRELPDSIVPCKYFQKFMNIALRFMESKKEEDKDTCAQELKEAMKVLPKDNYTILKYLCHFLRKLGMNEEKNKMSMMSLGIVFGYNIIRHIDKENSQLFLCTADLGQHLVYMFLHFYPKIFTLEYTDEGKEEHNVPTADLLRMSRVLDIPAAIPAGPAPLGCIAELEGLDLTLGSSRVTRTKSSDSSIRITDDYYSPVEMPNKDADNHSNSDDCVFVSSDEFVHDKKKSLRLNISEHSGLTRSQSTPVSPNSQNGTPPVPPRRTRSKITRNRNVSNRCRPEIYTDNRDKSPRSPVTPESVKSEDVLTALSMASTNAPTSANSSPASTLSRTSSDAISDTITTGTYEVVSHPREEETSATHGDGKLEPSPNDLLNQVTLLKEELVHQRERYRSQVSALKAQLTDMKEKYEWRIETMQIEHKSQKEELENKLEIEQSACMAAMATIAKLKEEIHSYHMQYGELSS